MDGTSSFAMFAAAFLFFYCEVEGLWGMKQERGYGYATNLYWLCNSLVVAPSFTPGNCRLGATNYTHFGFPELHNENKGLSLTFITVN